MDEVDRMMIGVRADTTGFARDVETLRATLEGTMDKAASRAATSIERSLLRAVKSGKLGFDELKAVALGVIDEIARAAVTRGIGAVLGTGGTGAGSAGAGGGGIGGLLSALIGLPGRATGGPVAPGQAYRVGERGPELFVPTTSGRIEAGGGGSGDGGSGDGRARDVRIAITVQTGAGAGAGEAPAALQRSSRQIARAVRAALAE